MQLLGQMVKNITVYITKLLPKVCTILHSHQWLMSSQFPHILVKTAFWGGGKKKVKLCIYSMKNKLAFKKQNKNKTKKSILKIIANLIRRIVSF